jgi:hypothetical protein
MGLTTYFDLVPSLGIREPVRPYIYTHTYTHTHTHTHTFIYSRCCVLLRTGTIWPELPSAACVQFCRAYVPNAYDYTHSKRVGGVAEQFG